MVGRVGESSFSEIRQFFVTDTTSTGNIYFQLSYILGKFIASRKTHDRNHEVNHPGISGRLGKH